MSETDSARRRLFLVRAPQEVRVAFTLRSPETVFLCTNQEAAKECVKMGAPYVVLDEDLIRGNYRRINQWAIEQALFFIRRYRDDKRKHLFLESYFYDIKSVFIRVLKYILVLDKVMDRQEQVELTAFGDGRSILEIAYAGYCGAINKSVTFNLLPKNKDSHASVFSRPFKAVAYEVAAIAINIASRFWLSRILGKKRRGPVFVSGAIQHLAPVVEELLAVKRRIIYGENFFNFEKYRYCARRGILLCVFDEPRRVMNPFESSQVCQSPDRIIFDGRDFSSIFNDIISNLGGDIALLNTGFDPDIIADFFKEYKPECVILDEDFAVRRVFMILAKEIGIPCFVISHGVPTVTMLGDEERPAGGYYESAVTFVNSDFEKSAFKSFFYDPDKLVVTGTPRYDALVKSNVSATASHRESAKKYILFAGQGTRNYDFEDHWAADLLGPRTVHLDYTRRYLKNLIEIASIRPDIYLRIKPHYEDQKAWGLLVGEAVRRGFCELLSPRADIFKLLAESDLVVTMPSSVICEAIMLDKPVITLNYGNDDLCDRYIRYGVVLMAADKQSLESAIQDCLAGGDAFAKMAAARRRHFEYFAGRFDGGASRRVAERISHGE